MTKLYLVAITLVLFAACSQPNKEIKPICQVKNFQSFEISYHAGWIGSFSFYVDSNKFYLAENNFDSIYYGQLPDSLFDQINTIVGKMPQINDRANFYYCADCDYVAIIAKKKNNIIHFSQNVDSLQFYLHTINSIRNFIDSSHHNIMNANIIFKSRTMLINATPPFKAFDSLKK